MSDRINIPGPSAKTITAQERAKAKANFAKWRERQGEKIKASRSLPVYAACAALAIELSDRREKLILTAEEIAKCEERAVSSERLRRFFALPRSAEDYQAQVAQIRSDWQMARAA